MARKPRSFFGIPYYSEKTLTEPQKVSTAKEKTPITAFLVVMSWFASTSLIGVGLFSTPYLRKVVRGEAAESLVQCLFAFLIGAIFCGWPWLLGFFKAFKPLHRRRVIGFSIATVLIAVQFYRSILHVPAEGVGLNLVVAVLLMWVAYPLSRVLGPRS